MTWTTFPFVVVAARYAHKVKAVYPTKYQPLSAVNGWAYMPTPV